MPNSNETFYQYDDNYVGPGAADELEEEEEVLRALNSKLMIGMQVLMNMLIYMSQGGAFTRGDMVTTPNTFDA